MVSRTMKTHSLIRTSPKGPGIPFIGTCRLCGKKNLPAEAVHEPCENVRDLSQDEAVIEAVSDE